jgi:2-isopropylmalate synthase
MLPSDKQNIIRKIISLFTEIKFGDTRSHNRKNPETYEHINLALAGNERRILISDLSGKSNIVPKFNEMEMGIKEI